MLPEVSFSSICFYFLTRAWNFGSNCFLFISISRLRILDWLYSEYSWNTRGFKNRCFDIWPDVNNSVVLRRCAAKWPEKRERQDGDRPGARGPQWVTDMGRWWHAVTPESDPPGPRSCVLESDCSKSREARQCPTRPALLIHRASEIKMM